MIDNKNYVCVYNLCMSHIIQLGSDEEMKL